MPFRLTLSQSEYHALCELVFKRDRWRCRRCKSGNNLHAHHIVFRSRGGDDASWNLIALCTGCHDGIHVELTLEIVARGGDRDDVVNADEGVKFLVVRR